jgi:hypothetical protein
MDEAGFRPLIGKIAIAKIAIAKIVRSNIEKQT